MNDLVKKTGNAGKTGTIQSMYSLKKSLFICLLLLVAGKGNVSAQAPKFAFGVRGGLNLSTAIVNDAAAIKIKPGYHIGGTVDYCFTQKFGLQSGLFLSEKGSKIDGFNSGDYVGGSPDYTFIFDALYLKLPVYATFRKNISDNFKVNIGLGAYFAYGIGGKTKQTLHNSAFADGNTAIEWNTFGNGVYDESRDWLRGETLRPFDFGAEIKVDFSYNQFIVGIGLESGIMDIMHEERDLHYRNENISISVGYQF
ncbi:MAG: PorT family protein [Prevotellaceae bacterium]|jgi:hypothetical protein|nr:PorT family protein [Prevotellaceae bacterium]